MVLDSSDKKRRCETGTEGAAIWAHADIRAHVWLGLAGAVWRAGFCQYLAASV